jgi:hypothetical protein
MTKNLFGAMVLALGLVGCIHEPTGEHLLGAKLGDAAPPPPSPALVASCQTTRTWHNMWVLTGSVFGGAGGLTGAAATISSNTTVQQGIAIGAIAAGLFGAISTAAAGITADSYATENCQQILQQAAAASAPH